MPFFQRSYSWKQQQWKQLFDDIWDYIIPDVIDQIKENPDQALTRDLFEDGLSAHEHYFGAIVVLERQNSHPSLKTFTIIDGQQRITTVYIILSLIVEILEKKADLTEKTKIYIEDLKKYVINSIDPNGDDYKKLKVYSNKGDRFPTYQKVFHENPSSPSLLVDHQLYVPEISKIDALWDYYQRKLNNLSIIELHYLSQALLKGLKVVWIPLDENKDNPQAIFEGLNDKGMPLSAVELLCSYLFKPLIDEVTKLHETIHSEKWLGSIKNVGGEDRFEFYLRNLFSIGKSKMIGKGRKLYSNFKNSSEELSKQDASDTINRLAEHVSTFNCIHHPREPSYRHEDEDIRMLLIEIDSTQMNSSIPFSLSVLIALKEGKIGKSVCTDLLDTLLTLLVRRKVCGLATTKYDKFLPSLLEKVINEGDPQKALKEAIRKEGSVC